MQKVITLPAPAEAVSGPTTAAPPSMEPILAVVHSLSRTLDCIKIMCATEPNGPVRDKLETERANLVIGLFVARVAAMRVASGDPVPDSAGSDLPAARRG